MNIPEILAPAGSYESFLAAIENGADAVYLGGKEFNARHYASNFNAEELARALEYAHLRNKRIYIVTNILLDQSELEPALEYIFQLQTMGVDGIIVQDLGFLQAIRGVFPDLRVHASTQMTIHNADGVFALQKLGVDRVVLARELQGSEIELIKKQCNKIELEFFVHGALCYSYSGQCLFSSVVGGRSGNRGKCAQPCRLVYSLLQNESPGPRGHLLSPADLCLLRELPELIASGIDSFKIEGRMKRPEYVAVVTKTYRQALDRYLEVPDKWSVRDQEIKDLAAIFNRDFSTNQWQGKNLAVLSPQRPNNRGVLIGRVVGRQEDGRVAIKLLETLRIGDGIEVWVKQGSSSTEIQRLSCNGNPVEEVPAGQTAEVDLPGRVGIGDRVFRTHDHRLIGEARETLNENRQRIPVTVRVEAASDKPLTIEIMDDQGNRARASTPSACQAAKKTPLQNQDIYDKVGRLGNTPWVVKAWDVIIDGEVMAPFSEINEARREASEELIELRLQKVRPVAISQKEYRNNLARINGTLKKQPMKERVAPRLSVRVSSLDTARMAIRSGADRIYLDSSFRQANVKKNVQGLNKLLNNKQAEIFIQLPGILKPVDHFFWDWLKENQFAKVLTGDLGILARMHREGYTVWADYTCNIFNSWTVNALAKQGAEGICLSPELNSEQIKKLLPTQLESEYIVYGRQPVMVSEHCVMGNLKDGQCARTCDKAAFSIRDEKGYIFPITTDRYCRMHLYNSRVTCLLDELPELMSYGLTWFRIDAVLESESQIEKVVSTYRRVLDTLVKGQKIDLKRIRNELEQASPAPFTRLHYQRGVL
ncbi:MAG: DUF3656 domain-containing U32 family peptidase [Chitinophagales bacterium]